MKNKNILTGMFVVTLMTFSACDDYLDLSPISSYNAGSFYKTQKDFELAAIGIYDDLQQLASGGDAQGFPAALESRSDNVKAYQANQYDQGYAIVSSFTDNSSTVNILFIWNRFFNMIDRCNAVIGKIDEGIFSDEARRSNLKGEAYFFRGYAYFHLAWMYGGVPIIDRQMKVDEIKQTMRSTQEATLTFAASDLIQAAELLPDAWPAHELGKVTQYAAKGILARLYMFQKRYADAKPLLQEIISSGKYIMATNYEDCFIDAYDNSPEHVFQVQYKSGNLGEGNAYVTWGVPENLRSAAFPGGGSRGCILSEDLYNAFEATDMRRDFSILKGWTNGAGQIDNNTLHLIKFAHGAIPAVKTDWEVNLPILRYTDVKMMYAEILNEEGYSPNGESFDILNEVRSRAGLAPVTSAEVPTQEAFREAILLERRLEFAGEFLRWFDLLRTDKAMSVMNNFFARADEQSGRYKMNEHQKIFAIPQDELNINPDTEYLWQNPGY
jgi:hypothetical protein